MLLLTDRPSEGQRFQKVFGSVGPCDMLSLDEATSAPPGHVLIACHADPIDPRQRDLLDAALTHHRDAVSVPVLFLVPDNSAGARKEAAAFNATEIVPESASRERLLLTIRRMFDTLQRSDYSLVPARKTAERSVEEVGGALAKLLDAAGRRETLSPAVLSRGAEVLVTAIRRDSIKSWLTVVRRYDNVTFQHCLLVAGLVTAFSMHLGLAPASQHLLAQAALVHDVGKAQIPQAILSKAGPLTPAEMQVMQTHPAIGHAVLSGQAGLHPVILDVTRHHHEYLDGSGYPDRLRGAQVSEYARLVTICDIYGALLERRPYKAPASPLEARSILHGMGGKLDGDLLKAFDAIVQAT